MTKLSEYRNVANFDNTKFEPMGIFAEPDAKIQWHNVSFDEETGYGSYLMIMAPGARSNLHRHEGAEEFFVLCGDLEDCDGHTYRSGDFVRLSKGSAHSSVSSSGCKLVVIHWGKTKDLSSREKDASS
ncbi:cupin domain-containing protein [Kiloniella sp. EL199]|uniref:cupin domain-containing protein n=1 Tax=Kiloniella sp. EL199 TaxID=2107581 RepID=UPI000EA0F80B|nr:cupin domain-containing protein [Kiloniella sp. EL199]